MIEVDTRERRPYKYPRRPVERRRAALPVGDYAVRYQQRVIAAVELMIPEDFTKSLIDGPLCQPRCSSSRPVTARLSTIHLPSPGG